MASRVNQERLAVRWEEVRQTLVHQATTTLALTARVALLGPLEAAVTITPAAADTTTPPPPERSQGSCKDNPNSYLDFQELT